MSLDSRHVYSVLVLVALPFAIAAGETDEPATPADPSQTRANDYSIEQIRSAWENREKRVQSAVFEWTEHRVQSQSFLAADESLSEPPDPEYDVTARLSFQGSNVRYSFTKSKWIIDSTDGRKEYVAVFNGTESKAFLPSGYVAEYPRGHVSDQKHSEELTASYLKPFLWAYRHSEPRVLLFPMNQAQLSAERALFEGRECLIVTHKPAPTLQHTLWIDPAQDFSIVRYSSLSDDTLLFQFDISYAVDSDHRSWIPKAWRYVTMNSSGLPQLSVNGELTSYSLNTALPPSEFEFDFPVATWVHDRHGKEYIIDATGAKRSVPVENRHLPYAELFNGASLERGGLRLLFWINVIVVLVLSSFLIFRWLQTKRPIGR